MVNAICATISMRLRLRRRVPCECDPRALTILSAGITSTRVDWIAGASPNSTPVSTESPATTTGQADAILQRFQSQMTATEFWPPAAWLVLSEQFVPERLPDVAGSSE